VTVLRLSFVALLGLAALSLSLVLAPAAGATVLTPSNPAPISIPSGPASDPGAASPYPSTITVSGAAGPVRDVDATIRSFSHTCPTDVDILLVGPGGQNTILLSDAGGSSSCIDASDVTFTLDDEAATTYPCEANPSGSFKPTNDPAACIPFVTPDAFPPPAPAGPYPVTLTVFDGTDPNGTWSLFVFDGAGGDSGTIAGGWSLAIDAPVNDFTIGKLKGKTLRLTVSDAGEIEVRDAADSSASGADAAAKKKRLKPSSATASGPGTVTVKLKLTKTAKKKLKQKRKVKVNAAITFTPTGGTANTESAKLKIKK
jgi:subtilisin-like proprotein convertase family protein